MDTELPVGVRRPTGSFRTTAEKAAAEKIRSNDEAEERAQTGDAQTTYVELRAIRRFALCHERGPQAGQDSTVPRSQNDIREGPSFISSRSCGLHSVI